MEAEANLVAVLWDINIGAGRDERLENVVCNLLLDILELLWVDDRLNRVASKVRMVLLEPVLVFQLVVSRDGSPGTNECLCFAFLGFLVLPVRWP